MSLRDLPKLRRVSLAESKVTDAGVAEFKNARPHRERHDQAHRHPRRRDDRPSRRPK